MNKGNYFSHDSNARNDDKIIAMRMQMGAEGYAIYFMLLERLRDSSDHMSVKDYNMLAFDFRVDASSVKRVVEGFGLFQFTDDGKQFYSESFTKRMQMMESKRIKQSEAGKLAMQRRWSCAPKVVTNLGERDNLLITNLGDSDNKENKRKEKKVNSIIDEHANAYSLSPSVESDAAKTETETTLFGEIPIEKKEDKIDFDKLLEYWNTKTNGAFGKLKVIDNNRRKLVVARIKQYGKQAMITAIDNAARSEYLHGAAWFDFDWMVRPNNFVKVLEDRYGKKDGLATDDHIGVSGEQGRSTEIHRTREYV